MSKVRDDLNIFFPGVKKEKFIHKLSRKETAYKKRTRMFLAKNRAYKHCGYWIKDQESIWVRNKKVCPAHTEVKKDLIEYRRVINRKDFYEEDEDGNLLLSYSTIGIYDEKEEFVPEHTYISGWTHKLTDIEPYLKRINIGKRKKEFKKISNRKIRNCKNLGNNSNYKKYFDIAWAIW